MVLAEDGVSHGDDRTVAEGVLVLSDSLSRDGSWTCDHIVSRTALAEFSRRGICNAAVAWETKRKTSDMLGAELSARVSEGAASGRTWLRSGGVG